MADKAEHLAHEATLAKTLVPYFNLAAAFLGK